MCIYSPVFIRLTVFQTEYPKVALSCVCIKSIISPSMCLQIFADVYCDTLQASVTRAFVFAQPLNPSHWLPRSPISAQTFSLYAGGECECLKSTARALSYNWGQISKPVRCQNISTTLCLHLLHTKTHKSRFALNIFCSMLRLLICRRFLSSWQACGSPSSWLGARTRRRSAIVLASPSGPVGIWRRPSIR